VATRCGWTTGSAGMFAGAYSTTPAYANHRCQPVHPSVRLCSALCQPLGTPPVGPITTGQPPPSDVREEIDDGAVFRFPVRQRVGHQPDSGTVAARSSPRRSSRVRRPRDFGPFISYQLLFFLFKRGEMLCLA
jgi:hypothetical protein